MKGIHSLLKTLSILALVSLNSSPLFANYGEPYNFYQPAPSNLLENVEKYHLNQGVEKVRQGKYEYAWSEFAFMLHYFPNHPKALQQAANLSIQMESPDRAERQFERAIRLYPNEAETHALYGIFLHNLKKYELAIEEYKKAIALNSHVIDYHYNLGLAYFALKDYQNARIEAEIAYNKGYPLPGLKDKLKSVRSTDESSSSS